MSEEPSANALERLAIGLKSKTIFVKVARIKRLTAVRYPLSPDRPMIKEEGIHVVVINESISCFSITFSFIYFVMSMLYHVVTNFLCIFWKPSMCFIKKNDFGSQAKL